MIWIAATSQLSVLDANSQGSQLCGSIAVQSVWAGTSSQHLWSWLPHCRIHVDSVTRKESWQASSSDDIHFKTAPCSSGQDTCHLSCSLTIWTRHLHREQTLSPRLPTTYRNRKRKENAVQDMCFAMNKLLFWVSNSIYLQLVGEN
jgi:hypothetical protein